MSQENRNFKKCQVVMLPNNNKVPINSILLREDGWGNWNKLVINKNPNFDEEANILGRDDIRYIPQHLYIISDEEIKDGDWVLETLNSVVFQVKSAGNDYKNSTFKKIIATTDNSLGRYFKLNELIPLPQPSSQFIQKYIEEYNKGKVITNVLVEYELDTYKDDGKTYHYSDGRMKLKVNLKDNTITIKPVEPKLYTEEELKQIVFKAYNWGYSDALAAEDNNFDFLEFKKENL